MPFTVQREQHEFSAYSMRRAEVLPKEQPLSATVAVADPDEKTLAQKMRENPEKFDFSDIEADFQQSKSSLPEVVGEYRRVEGRSGWYIRPLKARQQIQLMELLAATEDEGVSANARQGVTIGSLLLFRMDVSPEPEIASKQIIAHIRGEANVFKPATEDDVLDNFNTDEIMDGILRPMGFYEDGAKSQSPNEEAPTGGES